MEFKKKTCGFQQNDVTCGIMLNDKDWDYENCFVQIKLRIMHAILAWNYTDNPFMFNLCSLSPVFENTLGYSMNILLLLKPSTDFNILNKYLGFIFFVELNFYPGVKLYILTTRCRTEVRRNFFTNRVAEKWNKLPEFIKGAGNINTFKYLYDKIPE